VNLSVRIAVMDQRFAETGQQTEHDSRTYLAWSNSLTRTVQALGIKSAATRGPTLAEYMAAQSGNAA
jgi:hypothetical protein